MSEHWHSDTESSSTARLSSDASGASGASDASDVSSARGSASGQTSTMGWPDVDMDYVSEDENNGNVEQAADLGPQNVFDNMGGWIQAPPQMPLQPQVLPRLQLQSESESYFVVLHAGDQFPTILRPNQPSGFHASHFMHNLTHAATSENQWAEQPWWATNANEEQRPSSSMEAGSRRQVHELMRAVFPRQVEMTRRLTEGQQQSDQDELDRQQRQQRPG